MKTLWFRAVFVDDIVAGRKTDTYREASSRLPVEGERVALSVGPRRPFAIVIVESVERVRWRSMPAAKRSALLALGLRAGVDYRRVAFRLLECPTNAAESARSPSGAPQ